MKDEPLYVTIESLENGDAYFDLEVFRPIYGDELERVTQYTMDIEGKTLIIKLYDADKKIVLPKRQV